jgi:hypothetical protein
MVGPLQEHSLLPIPNFLLDTSQNSHEASLPSTSDRLLTRKEIPSQSITKMQDQEEEIGKGVVALGDETSQQGIGKLKNRTTTMRLVEC